MALRFDSKLAAPIIDLALQEDIGKEDVTSALINAKLKSKVEIISRESGLIAGLPIIAEVYKRISPAIKITLKISEGCHVKNGTRLAIVTGPTRAILSGERTVLNLLSIMSGIATLSAVYAKAVAGTGCKIYDTRKTIPGLRYLSKYAVKAGGCENHRFGLYDMVLIKDNHIAASGITKSIFEARAKYPKLPVMVETENWLQFLEALAGLPDYILLDNMNLQLMRRAVRTAALLGKDRPMLEASGGITLKSVLQVAKTGVDRISVGALTHSYKNMDLSMEMLEE
jgi:nicotinate-nucleotide pyrophosphorylase (carboxylating)